MMQPQMFEFKPPYYRLDMSLYSIIDKLDTYQPYCSFTATRMATLSGTGGTWDGPDFFRATARCQTLGDRFTVNIEVKPGSKNTPMQEQTLELDMSDLKAVTLELNRGASGRKYFLKLVPSVETKDLRTQSVSVSEISLQIRQIWLHQDSVIIINDERYGGRACSNMSGELVSLDIPGLGKIECALSAFRDAWPSGTLRNGSLTLHPAPDLSISITNVHTGRFDQLLLGGPYQVWVRWNPSDISLEEFTRQKTAWLEGMSDQQKMECGYSDHYIKTMLERFRKGQVLGCRVIDSIPEDDRIEEGEA